MGTGSESNGHGSVVITNYTDQPIDIEAIQDNNFAQGDRKIAHTISPRESYVIFTNKIEAFSWERSK